MNSVPQISEAEWVVMKALWGHSPQSASQVLEAVAHQRERKPKTVKTLPSRLVQKKALDFERSGKACRYRPLVTEEACARVRRRTLLQRVHDGAITAMLTASSPDDNLQLLANSPVIDAADNTAAGGPLDRRRRPLGRRRSARAKRSPRLWQRRRR